VTKLLAYLPQFFAMMTMNVPQIPAAQFMDANMATFNEMIAICVPLILVTLIVMFITHVQLILVIRDTGCKWM